MQDPLNIQENVSLKQYTTFRVGGAARFFTDISGADSLKLAIRFAQERQLPYFILGRGSNVVFSDAGFDGLVIRIVSKSSFHFSENSCEVFAGSSLSALARESIHRGLSGIHLLSGIPGTTGGAVYMNAGAYGQEIADCIREVRSFDPETETTVSRSREECEFGYRRSVFQKNKEIILSAILEFQNGDPEVLKEEAAKVMKERKEKQPLEFPNAGSAFKRPAAGFPGALIEAAGLKGFTVGGAQVSEKHANFIINTGNASAQDIYDLSEQIIQKVRAHSGITLEREIIFTGKF
ncbi:MAG: UDP-N-acetylmuramate dehydrogenase [Fibrobacter sp.]|jgi:UDP-N-acetylmuramate dehydrogenase|nr:UDP-N-acetylmuramate dehydrogenase [Fibrobacter sp.]